MNRIIKLGTIVLNGIYALIKLLPTKHKVVFISRQTDHPTVEFLMIEKELLEMDPQLQTVILCRTLKGGVESSIVNKMKYAFHMLVQMFHIATSEVVVLDTYCIVVSLLEHKKNLTIIQMWHSMGSMKKFGYTALDTEEGTRKELALAMKMHQNYDYVFASAEAYKEHLAKGFHCAMDKIITMPLPRLDLLKSEEYAESVRKKIYEKYPVLKDKPTILYCPTFRKDESRFQEALQSLLDAVDTERYNFVVKLHPLSKTKVKGNMIVAKEFSSFDMIFAADYFISDYSCIVYEAAVRNIPVFFYNFDMDLYVDKRGLAIDYYKELPGVISENPKEIADAIQEDDKYHLYDKKELKCFADKYIEPVEHATKNIADFIEHCIRDQKEE